jgi:hypothetical protein
VELDAPVLRAAVGRVVVGDGPFEPEARGLQAVGEDAIPSRSGEDRGWITSLA